MKLYLPRICYLNVGNVEYHSLLSKVVQHRMILKVILLGIVVIVSFSVDECTMSAVNNQCGLMNSGFKRIVGGSDVPYQKYPWYVVFIDRQTSQTRNRPRTGKRITTENLVNCGGTLITGHHVLTAGHCFEQ